MQESLTYFDFQETPTYIHFTKLGITNTDTQTKCSFFLTKTFQLLFSSFFSLRVPHLTTL